MAPKMRPPMIENTRYGTNDSRILPRFGPKSPCVSWNEPEIGLTPRWNSPTKPNMLNANATYTPGSHQHADPMKYAMPATIAHGHSRIARDSPNRTAVAMSA